MNIYWNIKYLHIKMAHQVSKETDSKQSMLKYIIVKILYLDMNKYFFCHLKKEESKKIWHWISQQQYSPLQN